MLTAAEIYHFQHERVIDFREMMKHFLDAQLEFYREVSPTCQRRGVSACPVPYAVYLLFQIIRKLEDARSQYNDGTDL